MLIIKNIKDLDKLINTNESAYFEINTDSLVNPKIFDLFDTTKKLSFKYLFKEKHAMIIEVENKVIRKINFTRKSEDGLYKSFRENDLPTILYFDKYLKKTEFTWKNGNELIRSNQFKPISIIFKKEYDIFSYVKPKNSEIYPSYINFSKINNKISGCVFRFYDKEFNITNIEKEFPNIFNATEEDCYDLSKNILTKEILTLKEIIKY